LDSGSYRLYLQLDKPLTIKIASLGRHTFQPGIYIYTGSAMRNLAKRIERHKRRKKTKHWHIDYLTSHSAFKIIKIETFPSEIKEECTMNAKVLARTGSRIPVKKFGSSDCRCISHLVYFETMPEI
jgi:Uri superfamily endonuclease